VDQHAGRSEWGPVYFAYGRSVGRPAHRLPAPRSTCHWRFQQWVQEGVFERVLGDLAEALLDLGLLDLSECFLDATFAAAKRGGRAVGKTKRGKGSKLRAVADANGRPLAVAIHRAQPHEVTLVQQTLAARFVDELPEHLGGATRPTTQIR
jgi:hypothetical protein